MSYQISKYGVEKLDPNASIQPGFAFKSARFTGDPNDLPLVKGENVHQGYIDWPESKRWPVDEYDSFSKYHLLPGDVVLAMDRPWVTAGLKWAYIRNHDPKSLLVQRVARIRAKGKLDQNYLRHVISSSYFANYLQPIVTGVNVPHISGKQIGNFWIPIPDLNIQRKIAAILTAYDDLIEINKRRIALLEKMAEELYREWFVRMRFPGHQNTKFVKGVPEGWTIQSLGDLETYLNGYAFKPSDWGDEGIPIIKIKEMSGGVANDTPRNSGRDIPEKYYFDDGTIIFSWSGTLLVMLWDQGPGLLNQHLFKVEPVPDIPKSFLFLALQFSIPLFAVLTTGATMQHIKRKELSFVQVKVPPKGLLKEFDVIVGPLLEAKLAITKAIRNLTQTRDLLLPRLISGRLSVENLDIQFPPSMRDED